MTTRSIFQKICPACMITLPLDARECACGNQFDHDDTDAALTSEEIRLKAEELYENYLAARAEQAAGAVMAAQAEFARNPASSQKSQFVAIAIQESEQARAALAAQSARVAEMKKALPPAPASRPIHVPAAPKKKNSCARPVVASLPERTIIKSAKPAANATDVASFRAKRVARKDKLAVAKNTPTPIPVETRPEINPPAVVQSKSPNPAFRQAQAARAEKILRKAETATAVKEVIREEIAAAPKLAAFPKVEPISPPPAPILIKSAPRLLLSERIECPNCTGSVDNKSRRCRCGYEFPPSDTLMPSLAMSEDERAEFAKLFSSP